MGTRTWVAEYEGQIITVSNHFRWFPMKTWEEVEVDGGLLVHQEGSLVQQSTTLFAQINGPSGLVLLEVRIAQLVGTLRVGCHIFVDGRLVGGDVDRKLNQPDPTQWSKVEKSGLTRFLLVRGILAMGVPYAFFMALATGSGSWPVRLSMFGLHATLFGGMMGYFFWRTRSAQYAAYQKAFKDVHEGLPMVEPSTRTEESDSMLLDASKSSIAGFWRRTAAALIDLSVLAAFGAAVGFLFSKALMEAGPQTRWLGLLPTTLYFGLMNGPWGMGQTLGKRLLNIRVVDQNGSRLTYPVSFSRAVLLCLSGIASGAVFNLGEGTPGLDLVGLVVGTLVFVIGPATLYLFVFNRKTRQGFHDLLLNTYVVAANDECTNLPEPEDLRQSHRRNWGAVAVNVLIFAVTYSVIGVWISRRTPDFKDMVALHAELPMMPGVSHGAVVGKPDFPLFDGVSFVHITLYTKHKVDDLQVWGKEMASLIAESHAWVREKDLVSVTAVSQYDLGIWRSVKAQHTVWKSADLFGEAAAQERDLRQQPVTTLAPTPTSDSVLLGGDDLDPYGYPNRHVNRVFVRSLLTHQRYADLTQYFEQFQKEFESDYRKEYWLTDAAAAFESAEPELTPALDAWVKSNPESFAPLLARGTHLVAVAYAHRGGNWSRNTNTDNMTEMKKALERANLDLDSAIVKNPRLVAAMRSKIRGLAFVGKHEELRTTVDTATKVCPLCFQVRVAYIYTLRPRWGGSYDAMDLFARESAHALNPKLRLLAGYANLDRVLDLRFAKDFKGALVLMDAACGLGDHWEFLVERAKIKAMLEDFKGAEADAQRAVALRPDHPLVLVPRAEVRFRQKRFEEAGQDLLAALRSDPTNADGRDLFEAVVSGLDYAGWEHQEAGRKGDALRVLDLAAELAPTNYDVRSRRFEIIAGASTPATAGVAVQIADLQKKAHASPDDIRAQQQFDYALSRLGRFAEIVPIWDRYLAKHPNDGRAYLERSGTYFHLRRFPEATTDAEKACKLGVSEGCVNAKRIKAAIQR